MLVHGRLRDVGACRYVNASSPPAIDGGQRASAAASASARGASRAVNRKRVRQSPRSIGRRPSAVPSVTNSALAIADPRRFPDVADVPQPARRLYALAAASLGAATREPADRADAAIAATLSEMLDREEGAELSQLFARAPSASVYRHLWRRLGDAWNAAPREAALQAYVFAIPVVLVAGHTVAGARVTLQGAIDDPS